MRKKLVVLLLMVCTATLVACGKSGDVDGDKPESKVTDEKEDGEDEESVKEETKELANWIGGTSEAETDVSEKTDEMRDGDGSIQEAPLYVKLTSNTYETERSFTGESRFFQFYLVNGRLFMEVDDRMEGDEYCYSAAELYPEDKNALFVQSSGKQEFTAMRRSFSGFSNMGEFSDYGDYVKIVLEGDELRIEEEDCRTYIAHTTENHETIHPSAKVLLEESGSAYPPTDSALYGTWLYQGEDGEEDLFEFGANHTFYCLKKVPGHPASYYLGAFVTDQEEGVISTYTQQMGWGGCPTDVEYKYYFDGDKLVVMTENYDGVFGRALTAVEISESPQNMKDSDEELYIPDMDY